MSYLNVILVIKLNTFTMVNCFNCVFCTCIGQKLTTLLTLLSAWFRFKYPHGNLPKENSSSMYRGYLQLVTQHKSIKPFVLFGCYPPRQGHNHCISNLSQIFPSISPSVCLNVVCLHRLHVYRWKDLQFWSSAGHL